MFRGVYTAIVTPFDRDGKVDFQRLVKLIRDQIEGGVDGIVPVGTTGESPTLSTEEHLEVVRVTIDQCARRVKVIAGTGANSTDEAIALTKAAIDMGADGTLQVTPYYNKPTDKGLIEHFAKVADLGLPTMIYNVPGRSAIPISLDVVKELSGHEHIVSIKEAGGSVDRVSQIKVACGDSISVVSGDDPLALPMIAVGAEGVVSVASNIVPNIVSQLIHNALDGNWEVAQDLHMEYHTLFSTMFCETNPLPVKTALAMMGKVEEVFRGPLCTMGDKSRERLEEVLQDYQLI